MCLSGAIRYMLMSSPLFFSSSFVSFFFPFFLSLPGNISDVQKFCILLAIFFLVLRKRVSDGGVKCSLLVHCIHIRSVASDEGKGTFLETLSVDGGQLRSYWIPSNRTGAVNEHQLGVHKYLMTNL